MNLPPLIYKVHNIMTCWLLIMLKLPHIINFFTSYDDINTAYNDESTVYNIMKGELYILLRFHYIIIQAPHIIQDVLHIIFDFNTRQSRCSIGNPDYWYSTYITLSQCDSHDYLYVLLVIISNPTLNVYKQFVRYPIFVLYLYTRLL